MGVWIEIFRKLQDRMQLTVTPLVGVWIEIFVTLSMWATQDVTPLVGVWIEMQNRASKTKGVRKSLPLWECGLKLFTVVRI